MSNVCVIGAGAWGTALAIVAAERGFNVSLYARNEEQALAINRTAENSAYLPNIKLPKAVAATSDIEWALRGCQRVFLTLPAQTVAPTLSKFARFVEEGAVIVSCAKGIDRQSGQFMSSIVRNYLPACDVTVLSGPSFACDVAQRLPTAVTVAATDIDIARCIAAELSGSILRCYASDDLVGVEMGGALKNIVAIAAGVVIGGGLGSSALAALTTRAFAEIRRVGRALKVREETLAGLAVLGDLMLTCSSTKSRNFSYGMALGKNCRVLPTKLAEGVASASIAVTLFDKLGVDAPIMTQTNELLCGRTSLREALDYLLSRPIKVED